MAVSYSNIGIPIQNEGLKSNSDLLEIDQGNTADLKMVVTKKKTEYSLFCSLLVICPLLILIGSTVFIFFHRLHSGNNTSLLHNHFARIKIKAMLKYFSIFNQSYHFSLLDMKNEGESCGFIIIHSKNYTFGLCKEGLTCQKFKDDRGPGTCHKYLWILESMGDASLSIV